jgi:poly-beta-1,6-N-acetyl-D-glucosamine biosynthesis protein PgaD
MHPENQLSPHAVQKAPPPRLRSWGQPAGEEPIIDAARIPLHAFGDGRSPQRTLAMYLWLRVLRPALTIASWFCAIWYAWPYVMGARSQPEVLHLLGLYAIVIGAILASMLLMGPLRRRQHRRETPPEKEQSSLFALASYIAVPPARLSDWQRIRQLRVHHDHHGQLRDAADHDTTPAALEEETPAQSRKA